MERVLDCAAEEAGCGRPARGVVFGSSPEGNISLKSSSRNKSVLPREFQDEIINPIRRAGLSISLLIGFGVLPEFGAPGIESQSCSVKILRNHFFIQPLFYPYPN